MKKGYLILACLAGFMLCQAQQPELREGNKWSKEGKYDEALSAYDKALLADPANMTAAYNRANTLARKGDKAASLEAYDKLSSSSNATAEGKKIRERAYYDKGVLHQQQQQLDASIEAWKAALKLDPEDSLARDNLQKALREKKQQQQQQQQQQQEEKKKDQKQDKQPSPPPPSKLNQKQVEQLLKALEQKEKEVQKKLQQQNASPNKPDKDW